MPVAGDVVKTLQARLTEIEEKLDPLVKEADELREALRRLLGNEQQASAGRRRARASTAGSARVGGPAPHADGPARPSSRRSSPSPRPPIRSPRRRAQPRHHLHDPHQADQGRRGRQGRAWLPGGVTPGRGRCGHATPAGAWLGRCVRVAHPSRARRPAGCGRCCWERRSESRCASSSAAGPMPTRSPRSGRPGIGAVISQASSVPQLWIRVKVVPHLPGSANSLSASRRSETSSSALNLSSSRDSSATLN
jgi:hypothetical protein